MAKGLATRYEAIIQTKPGALDAGAAIAQYSGGTGGGDIFAECSATDSVSPMILTVYNVDASAAIYASVRLASDLTAIPATTLYKIAAGASKRFIVGAGWFFNVWAIGSAVVFNIESYNATITQANNT